VKFDAATLRALRRELRTDFRLMTIDFLVNAVLGSDLVPRPVRYLGYRALGMPTATPNILPGLRMSGSRRRVSIGAGTFVNRGCFFEAVGNISIGRGCQIGPEVMILTSHHPRTPAGDIERAASPRNVLVGDRVWLGARSLITPGVIIGDDVAIAAGAVVTKNCLEPGMYAGVPARLIQSAESTSTPDNGVRKVREASMSAQGNR
jgi:acetyltransferase-like isoleucine patch superfamily enzyme